MPVWGWSVFYEPDVSDTRYTLSCPGVGAVKATESQHLSMRIDGGSFALNKQLELFWVYKDSGREVSPLVAITFLYHWKERFYFTLRCRYTGYPGQHKSVRGVFHLTGSKED